MVETVYEKVKKTIEKHGLIEAGDTLIVGFSGGPDSVCLLHVLNRMKEELNLEIHGVHMNHCLRGKDADQDERYAKQFCEGLNIPFHAFKCDVNLMGLEEKMTTEEAGRQARYDAFEKVKSSLGGKAKIAVAHNLDDQAETVLMRILRGTGPNGLAAMDYKREGDVIRPLLDVTREEIEKYCTLLKLKPRVDLTNLEPLYARNKVRLELLPLLEKDYNSNILEALVRLSAIAKEDKDYFEREVSRAVTELVKEKGEDFVLIKRPEYRTLHPALAKRVLNSLLKEIGMDKDITAFHLDKADESIRQGNTGDQMDFPLSFAMTLSYEEARLLKNAETNPRKNAESNEQKGSYNYRLKLDDVTEIPEINARIKSSLENWGESELAVKLAEAGKSKNRLAILDFAKIRESKIEGTGNSSEGPVVRTRRAGDIINPLGMKGTKKLQDYFVDKKIPREEREKTPMLCLANEVVWIPGLVISDKYKANEKTKDVLLLEIFLSL